MGGEAVGQGAKADQRREREEGSPIGPKRGDILRKGKKKIYRGTSWKIKKTNSPNC